MMKKSYAEGSHFWEFLPQFVYEIGFVPFNRINVNEFIRGGKI
ncbi:hypothetical protein BAT_1030 [Bacillus pumilus ATCC 7061]|nr:hypothetical protein BAT_1030 [Bacillus pumilus ATCC 7061]